MRSIDITAAQASPARIICLPGAYDAPEDFAAAGFAESVGSRGLAIDLLLVDVELRDLGDTGVSARLRHEIVQPARAQGYRSIWMAGISLGGLLALDYAAVYPADLDGVCALAPYLGDRMLLADVAQRVAQRPGVDSGTAAATTVDPAHRVWHYLRTRRPRQCPQIHLGFGCEDRFAAGHRLMATLLPEDAVDVAVGAHDWKTWAKLWDSFLDAKFR